MIGEEEKCPVTLVLYQAILMSALVPHLHLLANRTALLFQGMRCKREKVILYESSVFDHLMTCRTPIGGQ